MALRIIHLHRQPPTQRRRIAFPFAFDIHRHHVVHANQLSQRIRSDIVLVGVHEVHFSAHGKLLHGFVFIHRLERGVVGHGAVRKRKPHGVSDAFLGLLTAHHLGGEKELLNLFLSQGWPVRSNPEESPSHTHHPRNHHPPPPHMKWIHGRSSTERLELYSFAPPSPT